MQIEFFNVTKNKDGFSWRKTGILDKKSYNLLIINTSYFCFNLYFLHLKPHRFTKTVFY